MLSSLMCCHRFLAKPITKSHYKYIFCSEIFAFHVISGISFIIVVIVFLLFFNSVHSLEDWFWDFFYPSTKFHVSWHLIKIMSVFTVNTGKAKPNNWLFFSCFLSIALVFGFWLLVWIKQKICVNYRLISILNPNLVTKKTNWCDIQKMSAIKNRETISWELEYPTGEDRHTNRRRTTSANSDDILTNCVTLLCHSNHIKCFLNSNEEKKLFQQNLCFASKKSFGSEIIKF